MTEKIYIARHGFRLNWVTSTWESPTGLARDPPLAAYGDTQAEELAQYFLSLPEDERPTVIFSSPYYRCLQTSKPTAKALGLPIYVEHGLSEWYSPVVPGTGLHPRPGPAHSLKTYFSEIDSSWDSIYYPTRKGETVEELHDRIDSFTNGFFAAKAAPKAAHLSAEKWKRVLLVSHAATVIALVRSFLGDRDVDIKAGCCSLSELVKKDVDGASTPIGAYKAIKLVNGDHMKGGSDREWGFDHIEVEKGRVVEDPGVPGSENEKDEPVGLVIDPLQTVNSSL